MKVLEKGTGQKGWSTKARCTGEGNGMGGCGALLLIEQKDLYHTHNYDYTGGHDVFNTFTCCECGVETDIKYTGHEALPDKPKWLKDKKK